MTRKICVITGSRAEYGLLKQLMAGLERDPNITLQVVATGMHLAPEFGRTYQEIEADGFRIDRKIEMLTSSDSSVGVAKSMGLGLIGFSDALSQLSPDLLVVLGDRFEIFAAVAAALVARIPIAHLHGGETTEAVFDESLRHSITKMSHLHFVAAEAYRRRVIQLGEDPEKVFMVGGLGVDSIQTLTLLKRHELEASLGIIFGKRNLLITFHPVTLESSTANAQLRELLLALSALEDTNLIFTLPNADNDSRELANMVNAFAREHKNASVFASLGHVRYLSCIACVDGVVGNSSSGLLEVPSFKKGTINIGDRQRGRLQASSVINCEPNRPAIEAALRKLYDPDFQAVLQKAENPYGSGGASTKILDVLQSYPLEGLQIKKFYDIAAFNGNEQ